MGYSLKLVLKRLQSKLIGQTEFAKQIPDLKALSEHLEIFV